MFYSINSTNLQGFSVKNNVWFQSKTKFVVFPFSEIKIVKILKTISEKLRFLLVSGKLIYAFLSDYQAILFQQFQHETEQRHETQKSEPDFLTIWLSLGTLKFNCRYFGPIPTVHRLPKQTTTAEVIRGLLLLTSSC